MKPRQIKKNSKSAMDLLIKVFGFREHDFYYSEYYKSIRASEKIGMFYSTWSPESLLANRFFKYKKWEITFNSNISAKKLFSECRQLAKSGVKFR